jgi:hypothetical protein
MALDQLGVQLLAQSPPRVGILWIVGHIPQWVRVLLQIVQLFGRSPTAQCPLGCLQITPASIRSPTAERTGETLTS